MPSLRIVVENPVDESLGKLHLGINGAEEVVLDPVGYPLHRIGQDVEALLPLHSFPGNLIRGKHMQTREHRRPPPESTYSNDSCFQFHYLSMSQMYLDLFSDFVELRVAN